MVVTTYLGDVQPSPTVTRRILECVGSLRNLKEARLLSDPPPLQAAIPENLRANLSRFRPGATS
jgi:hypothetical protein